MSDFVNADGSAWVPEFEGQRPPFQPGNRLADLGTRNLQHGVWSSRLTGPIARRVARDLRRTPGCEYLSTPRFAARLSKYATVVAQSELLEAWMQGKSIDELADSAGGKTSAYELSRQLTVRASNLAELLGLSPDVKPEVQADIDASRRTLAKRAEAKRLHDDLVEGMREQMFPGGVVSGDALRAAFDANDALLRGFSGFPVDGSDGEVD